MARNGSTQHGWLVHVALIGICVCAVPTLSEWGIIGMAVVMFGGVVYMRRRRDENA